MEYDLFTLSVEGLVKKTYTIYKNDVHAYTAVPKSFFSKSYHLYNADDQLLLDINFSLTPFNRKVEIIDVDGWAGTIRKKVFSQVYEIESYNGDYRIEGNFWSTKFDIFFDNRQIAKASRKRFTKTNAYGLAVVQDVDEDFLVSMLVSMILFRKKQNN